MHGRLQPCGRPQVGVTSVRTLHATMGGVHGTARVPVPGLSSSIEQPLLWMNGSAPRLAPSHAPGPSPTLPPPALRRVQWAGWRTRSASWSRR